MDTEEKILLACIKNTAYPVERLTAKYGYTMLDLQKIKNASSK